MAIGQFNAEDKIGLKLLENSIFFLTGDIDNDSIDQAIKWLTYENLLNKTDSVTLYINSFGGSLYDALALVDVMRSSKRPVSTVGVGAVMSAAFLIFAAGAKGERYIGRNAGIMCHQYSDTFEGKHHDLKASIKEGENCNVKMFNILKEATGLPIGKIRSKMLRETDVFLTAEELVELGVADYVLDEVE